MRSQFLLDFSDATCMKPNIHAAFRDFDPADFCLLLARSQHLKGLVGGACRPVPPAPACRGASRGSRQTVPPAQDDLGSADRSRLAMDHPIKNPQNPRSQDLKNLAPNIPRDTADRSQLKSPFMAIITICCDEHRYFL